MDGGVYRKHLLAEVSFQCKDGKGKAGMSNILLAIDENTTAGILKRILKTEGYKPVSVSEIQEASELLETEKFNLVVYSANSEWDSSLEVLEVANRKNPNMPVLVIVEQSEEELSSKVQAYEPFAMLSKPLKIDELMSKVQQAVDFSDESLSESVNLNLQLEGFYRFGEVVAESQTMKNVCDMVNRIAATDVPVLIAGEHGTGRRLLANVIHKESQRSGRALRQVECNAESADKLLGKTETSSDFEEANGGTLVLSDIEGLPLDSQSRLTDCLKESKLTTQDGRAVQFNVRIIATVGNNAETLAREGKLDPELYKFLRVIFIRIPPLRKRPKDVLATVRHIFRSRVGENAALPGLEPEAVTALENYDWPGNVSEMEEVIDSALKNMGENNRISLQDLPAEIRGS